MHQKHEAKNLWFFTKIYPYKYYFKGYNARHPINIALNAWSSAAINAELVRILLEEVIGIQTTLVSIAETAVMWEAIAQGNIHAAMEYW